MTSRMSTHRYGRVIPAFLIALALACQAVAQTKIVAPKNSYKVGDDVKLGRSYSPKLPLSVIKPKPKPKPKK